MSGVVTGVDFVALPTQDIDRAVAFYGETLGLEYSRQWGEMPAHEFENGTVTIAVIDPSAFGRPFQPSSAIVALQVDDVEAMRARLEQEGVMFPVPTIDSGVCLIAPFTDPDGNSLMLHHRYAPH